MQLNYHFVLTHVLNAESQHVGAKCAIIGHKAQLGKDYGIANLMVMKSNHGDWVTPESLYVVKVIYEDNSWRSLGLKAKKDDENTIRLYGQKSVWTFVDLLK